MSISRRRVTTLIATLSLLLAATAFGSVDAVAAPSPSPQPSGPKRAGPWPPERVLAGDPGSIKPPIASRSTPPCPTPRYGVQSVAPGAGKTVALTFDDGPGPSTQPILTILQNYGVPATFFNIGVNANARPAQVRAQAAIGASLGNHTWGHPSMPSLGAAAQGVEMDRATSTQSAIVAQPSCLFRPPYGEYNTTTLDLAFERRMSVWLWSVDTEDWKAEGSGAQMWIDRIVARAQAGGSQQHPVILMHNQPTGNPATVAALPRIIEYYRSLGYTFVDLGGRSGYTVPGPTAATTQGAVHVYTRGTADNLVRRSRVNGSWTAPTSLGGGMVDGPAAAPATPDSNDVFITGLDTHLWTRSVTAAGGGSGWSDLGGLLTSRPAVARAADGTVSVVARGGDSGAWLRERAPNGVWGPWQGLGGVFTSALSATYTSGGLVIAGIGRNGAVWIRNRAAGWSRWRSAGGLATSEPALSATVGGNGVALFVRGGDNAMWLRVGDAAGNFPAPWSTLGGLISSGTAVTQNGSQLEIYIFSGDGRLWTNVASNGAAATGWSGWSVLP
jgi:peptidoglycan/xylan/chitin deacetylase (PgdA/CDA1 family)